VLNSRCSGSQLACWARVGVAPAHEALLPHLHQVLPVAVPRYDRNAGKCVQQKWQAFHPQYRARHLYKDAPQRTPSWSFEVSCERLRSCPEFATNARVLVNGSGYVPIQQAEWQPICENLRDVLLLLSGPARPHRHPLRAMSRPYADSVLVQAPCSEQVRHRPPQAATPPCIQLLQSLSRWMLAGNAPPRTTARTSPSQGIHRGEGLSQLPVMDEVRRCALLRPPVRRVPTR
jgi:hypothetical protein